MDTPEILHLIVRELPLQSQLVCTLVSKQWHAITTEIIERYNLVDTPLERQLDTLRCFTLDRTTTNNFQSLQKHHLTHQDIPRFTNLTSLTISPNARISSNEINKRTGEYDNSLLCLKNLLPRLEKLRHLYLHGQDLRNGRNSRSGRSGREARDSASLETRKVLGGTDAALIAFAASRRAKNLPGLQTLSIISSPDLSDEGLLSYFSLSSSLEDAHLSEGIPQMETDLGNSLTSLALVNCPLLTSVSLEVLANSCRNIQQLTLKNVDGLFEKSSTSSPADTVSATSTGQLEGREEASTPNSIDSTGSNNEIFHQIIRSNSNSLHSFTFSSNLASLPPDFFEVFNTSCNSTSTTIKLQNLTFTQVKSLQPHHLSSFPSITSLSITGCPLITDDLPFNSIPNLRELSYLGKGLSVDGIWKLFKLKIIRKITIDAAGLAYETCICEEEKETSIQVSTQHQACAPVGGRIDGSIDVEEVELLGNQLPTPLQAFKKRNILSSDIPSWVLAYLLSHAPESLEAFTLLGTIVPTCDSIRPSPSASPSTSSPSNATGSTAAATPNSTHAGGMVTPASTSLMMISAGSAYNLRPLAIAAPDYASIIPVNGDMETDTTTWPVIRLILFWTIRNLLKYLVDWSLALRRSLDRFTSNTPQQQQRHSDETFRISGSMSDMSSHSTPARRGRQTNINESVIQHYSERLVTHEKGNTSKLEKKNNRRRSQSTSLLPSKRLSRPRMALQRSTTEYQIPIQGSLNLAEYLYPAAPTTTARGRAWTTVHSINSVRPDKQTNHQPHHLDDSPSTPQESRTIRSQAENEESVDTDINLQRLLAVSEPINGQNNISLVTPSRLNEAQIHWLHTTTKGRIVRLEV